MIEYRQSASSEASIGVSSFLTGGIPEGPGTIPGHSLLADPERKIGGVAEGVEGREKRVAGKSQGAV